MPSNSAPARIPPARAKKKPPSPAASFQQAMERLFELGRDTRERCIELGAEAIDHGNNRNRNAGGNETIFYGRGPRIVLQERTDLTHLKPRVGVFQCGNFSSSGLKTPPISRLTF